MGDRPRKPNLPERHATVAELDQPRALPADARQAPPPPGGPWPNWAKGLVTAIILVHTTAVLAGALGVSPSSSLEQAIADKFTGYFDLLDMGYSYRFYAEPPPTPIIIATIHFPSGPDQTMRLPDRNSPDPECVTSDNSLSLTLSSPTPTPPGIRARPAAKSRSLALTHGISA